MPYFTKRVTLKSLWQKFTTTHLNDGSHFPMKEFKEQEPNGNKEDKYVECGEHKYMRRAFVCQHLNNKTIVGFEEAFESAADMELEDEEDFQAWCYACEKERQKEGEWNDKSEAFAKIKLVCEKCYFEMKELNLGHK